MPGPYGEYSDKSQQIGRKLVVFAANTSVLWPDFNKIYKKFINFRISQKNHCYFFVFRV